MQRSSQYPTFVGKSMLKALMGLCTAVAGTQSPRMFPFLRHTLEIPDSFLSRVEFLTGRFDPQTEPYFMTVPETLTLQKGARLLFPVVRAFVRMAQAAQKDGIILKVLSATRTFDKQKQIWEDKWFGRRLVEGRNLHHENVPPLERARLIMRYSAMPGTSRHHWGTDVDINAVEEGYFQSAPGLQEYNWLMRNAHRFGFCQVYTARSTGRTTGYEEEKWHWSYMPYASRIRLLYNQIVNYSHLQGFAGAEAATELKVIENYVNGIHIACDSLTTEQ
ncbi:MAG: M15 family metallopeptidase [Flavobacteriales bacterium]|nr:M15 family metallopeptidase [Flavobacteriales bacterium]